MDIKIQGITEDIMKTALAQAKAGRLHILGEMANALTAPRPELSDFAPRLITIKIHPDKIREVIGKGGSVIQAITKDTGPQIDIQDRSEEHTSELKSLMRISYAVLCLNKKT